MQRVVPTVRVSSYLERKPFFESLGFHEQWVHRFEPGFPAFASIVRDGMEVFLTEHTGDCQFGALVHFHVDDVDALYEEFKRHDVASIEPPHNDLGPSLRCMGVVDPDGNQFRFITEVGRWSSQDA